MKRFFSAPLASNPQEERQTNPVLPFLSFFSKKLDWMQILPMLALLAIGA